MEPLMVQTLNDTGNGRLFARRVVCPLHGEIMFTPDLEGTRLAAGAAQDHAACSQPPLHARTVFGDERAEAMATAVRRGPAAEMFSDAMGIAAGRCPVHGVEVFGDTQRITSPDAISAATERWASLHVFCGSPAALAEVASTRRHPAKSRRRAGCAA